MPSSDAEPGVACVPVPVPAEAVHELATEAVAVARNLMDVQRRLRARKAVFAISFTVCGVVAVPTALGGYPGVSLVALAGALATFVSYLWTELVLDASLLTQLLTDWNVHLRQARKLSFLSPPTGPLSASAAVDAIDLNVQADGLRLRSAAFLSNTFRRDGFFDLPRTVSDR